METFPKGKEKTEIRVSVCGEKCLWCMGDWGISRTSSTWEEMKEPQTQKQSRSIWKTRDSEQEFWKAFLCSLMTGLMKGGLVDRRMRNGKMGYCKDPISHPVTKICHEWPWVMQGNLLHSHSINYPTIPRTGQSAVLASHTICITY